MQEKIENVYWLLLQYWEPLSIWCRVWESCWDRPSAIGLTKTICSLWIFPPKKVGLIVFWAYDTFQRVIVVCNFGRSDISWKERSILLRRWIPFTLPNRLHKIITLKYKNWANTPLFEACFWIIEYILSSFSFYVRTFKIIHLNSTHSFKYCHSKK